MRTEVNISFIFSSEGHNYFTRTKFDVGNYLTHRLESIYLEGGRGIKGDRFEFSKYPITFINEEVMKEVCSQLELPYNPLLFRRNIVISGVNLNQLIGRRFIIRNEVSEEDVVFEGIEHCSPCPWMNAVMKKGAYKLMSGRGGLRVKVLEKGLLKSGPNTLITQDEFMLLDPLEALKKPRIP